MRRGEREIRERADIDRIIRGAKVMRLGMTDGLCPYVVPLCFGYDGSSLYFHCAPQGRKIDIIGTNGRVCFEIDELTEITRAPGACGWAAQYRSVIGEGRAVVLSDTEQKRRGLRIVMAQYADGTHDFADREIERVCVVRIDIVGITGKASIA